MGKQWKHQRQNPTAPEEPVAPDSPAEIASEPAGGVYEGHHPASVEYRDGKLIDASSD